MATKSPFTKQVWQNLPSIFSSLSNFISEYVFNFKSNSHISSKGSCVLLSPPIIIKYWSLYPTQVWLALTFGFKLFLFTSTFSIIAFGFCSFIFSGMSNFTMNKSLLYSSSFGPWPPNKYNTSPILQQDCPSLSWMGHPCISHWFQIFFSISYKKISCMTLSLSSKPAYITIYLSYITAVLWPSLALGQRTFPEFVISVHFFKLKLKFHKSFIFPDTPLPPKIIISLFL